MSLGIRPYSTMPKVSADCSDLARYSIPRYPMYESLRVASFWATGMFQLPTCWGPGACAHTSHGPVDVQKGKEDIEFLGNFPCENWW